LSNYTRIITLGRKLILRKIEYMEFKLFNFLNILFESEYNFFYFDVIFKLLSNTKILLYSYKYQ